MSRKGRSDLQYRIWLNFKHHGKVPESDLLELKREIEELCLARGYVVRALTMYAKDERVIASGGDHDDADQAGAGRR